MISYHLRWIRLFAVNIWIRTGFQQVVLIHQSSFHQCVAELHHCLEARHAKLRKHSVAKLSIISFTAGNTRSSPIVCGFAVSAISLDILYEAIWPYSCRLSVCLKRDRIVVCFASSSRSFLKSLPILFECILLRWSWSRLGFIASLEKIEPHTRHIGRVASYGAVANQILKCSYIEALSLS